MSCLQVKWQGEELWLEAELRHFSKLGKAWKRLSGCRDEELQSGPLALAPLRTPFGSKPVPKGYVKVSNFTDVSNTSVLNIVLRSIVLRVLVLC